MAPKNTRRYENVTFLKCKINENPTVVWIALKPNRKGLDFVKKIAAVLMAAVVGINIQTSAFAETKTHSARSAARDKAAKSSAVEKAERANKADSESFERLDLTAEELLFEARKAREQGDFKKAAALFTQFLADFGSSPMVAQRLGAFRYERATALLQAKDLPEALEAIDEALATSPLPDAAQIQELKFWRAICFMQSGDYAAALTAIDDFLALFPTRFQPNSPAWFHSNPGARRVPEAKLLRGTALLLANKTAEGVEYLESVKPELPEEARGRATVLQLYGLVEDANSPSSREQALDLVVREYPNLASLTQIIAFQVLTLQLGSQFLEADENRKAIRCLQRVWESERLLRHQEKHLADLEAREKALASNPKADPFEQYQNAQILAKVRRELQTFQKIENFDSALRLRLARAYQGMGRYREAALILEDMLERMDADPVVESASTTLVQNWSALERWDKAIIAAQKFAEKFPESKNRPLVAYLRGLAEQKILDYPAALATFEEIQKDFPASEFAARALFQVGFTYLLAENHAAAVKAFEALPDKYKSSDLVEAAAFWRGMAYSLDKNYAKAREVFSEYLKNYPSGAHRGAAEFRKAYCAQQEMDFETSIRELRSFLKNHPGHENMPEALLLLGDALMATGDIEGGIAAFRRIPPEHTRFFEEGFFKIGRAYKQLEEPEKLIKHMESFVESYPQSPRVAEALFQIADTHRRMGNEDKARAIYWDAIERYGADPAMRSIEEAFLALSRFYKGAEAQAEYRARLQAMQSRSENPTLRMRLLWAEGIALRKIDPARSVSLLIDAAALANPQTTNPLLLSDFADALASIGNDAAAEQMRRDLVKWNPRSPFKDKALAEIGFAELRRKKFEQALKTFERFEREHPTSPRLGSVLLAKAALLRDKGKSKDALATLESLLASDIVPKQAKAEALYRIGELHLEEGRPELAVPYFTRVFVMYGRWAEWVARSYLANGQAFERLKDMDAARRTYAEMLAREELSNFPEAATARERLEKLGGPPPAKPPTQQPGDAS